MLWCLRVMLLVVPVGVIAVLLYLMQAGRELQFRQDGDLVFVVSEKVGLIDSFADLRGAERQVESLIFDRLFRPDDERVLRAGLARSWIYRQRLTFFFADEKLAEQAELQVLERLVEEKKLRPTEKFQEIVREGSSLTVFLSAYDTRNAREVMDFLKGLKYQQVIKLRLSLKGAVRESWADFKKNSAEKKQLKREWIEGDQAVVMFVAGDAEQFLKELRLYYESNGNLDPEIDIISQAAYLDVAEWWVTLRAGVVWHDGQAFSAEDVLFSYETMARPHRATPLTGAFSHVAALRVLDDLRFVVQCREYYAPVAESWQQLPILPAHLLKGKKTEQQWLAFFQQPVGTGAFVFDQRTEDGELVLKRNHNYFLAMPRQEVLRFKWVTDDNERMRGMLTGALDVLWPSGDERRWMREKEGFEVLDESYSKQTLVAWNLQRPVFHNPQVRRALAHWVDLPALLAAEGEGGRRLCRGIFYPGSWFCEKEMQLPALDVEKGRALLEQAGWREEDDAWRSASGERLAFKLLVDQDSPEHMRVAELLAQGWQAHGVEVEVFPMAWAELVEDHLLLRDFDAALISWELESGRDQYRVWHSAESERGGGNIFALRSAPVDQLLQSLQRESDPDEVRKLAQALQDKIVQLQAALFLTESAESVVLREGAVRSSRLGKNGVWSDEAARSSTAGLRYDWQWWVSAAREGDGNE